MNDQLQAAIGDLAAMAQAATADVPEAERDGKFLALLMMLLKELLPILLKMMK